MNLTNSPQNFTAIKILTFLAEVTESKLLGVMIDNLLSFKAHIDNMCKISLPLLEI